MIALLQTLQWAFESAGQAVVNTEPKFLILNLASIHVEVFENTVLPWFTNEFFCRTLLLTAKGVTEPVGHIVCVGE